MNDGPKTQERDRATDSSIEVLERENNGDDQGFLPPQRMDELRRRWSDIQANFVDDPRRSVEQAHALVECVVNELTEVFTQERTSLEGQWARGQQADTEALRVALKRYREFFNRLLRTDTLA